MPEPFPPNLHVGTSSWSSPDWCGSFYPDSVDPGDRIRVYSEKLRTVEVDSTWYRTPSRKTVESWKTKTPAGFIFSAKVPRVISHDKYLEGCETDLNEFVSVMSRLDPSPKGGPGQGVPGLHLFQQPLRRVRPGIGGAV
jgi:uncharacterized protein YecE (DUF72 family)